jgi:hypothetical protein
MRVNYPKRGSKPRLSQITTTRQQNANRNTIKQSRDYRINWCSTCANIAASLILNLFIN